MVSTNYVNVFGIRWICDSYVCIKSTMMIMRLMSLWIVVIDNGYFGFANIVCDWCADMIYAYYWMLC